MLADHRIGDISSALPNSQVPHDLRRYEGWAGALRPTAHRPDQLVSILTGNPCSFGGIVVGLPSVVLTTTGREAPHRCAPGIPPDGATVIAANYGGIKQPGPGVLIGSARTPVVSCSLMASRNP
jgi:hypothetical protein